MDTREASRPDASETRVERLGMVSGSAGSRSSGPDNFHDEVVATKEVVVGTELDVDDFLFNAAPHSSSQLIGTTKSS